MKKFIATSKLFYFSRLHKITKVYFIPVLILIFVNFYYLAPSYTSCSTITNGFGDNTAGLIWRNQVSPESPLGGFQTATNFPDGESLYTPARYSNLMQFTMHWGLSKVVGPICGYSMFIITGLLITSIITYLFLFYVTRRNKALSLLGALIVSYSPYLQLKIGGHPSYAYFGLVIGIVWSLISFYMNRSYKSFIAASLLTAFCFYLDPYFVLLAVMAWIPFLILEGRGLFLFLHSNNRKDIDRGIVKKYSMAFLIMLTLIAPLVYVRIAYSDEINSEVGAARGAGQDLAAAQICSNLPQEYFIPSEQNAFIRNSELGPSYSKFTRLSGHTCNPSEDNVGISLVVGISLLFYSAVLIWSYLENRRISKNFNKLEKVTIAYSLIGLVTAVLFALPPTIVGIKMPSFYLIEYIGMWRIPARLYLIVVLMSVSIFVILTGRIFLQAYVFKNKRGKVVKKILLILVVTLVIIEYQLTMPFGPSRSSFNYDKDFPQVYELLRSRSDIKVIAEYPLDRVGESEASSLFLTAQPLHQKMILNSTLSNSPTEPVRQAIKDLKSPQTVRVLKALGVNTLIIRSVSTEDVEEIEGLNVIYYENYTNKIYGGTYVLAQIDESVLPLYSVIVPVSGFVSNASIAKNSIDMQIEAVNNAVIRLVNLSDYYHSLEEQPETKNNQYCFDVTLASNPGQEEFTTTFYLKDKAGSVITEKNISSSHFTNINVVVDTDEELVLSNHNGYNMRLDNLGCN